MSSTGVGELVEERKKLAAALLQSDGFYKPLNADQFAEDYVFEGAVIGPLCKADVINTVSFFGVHAAFPDMEVTSCEWSQDPNDPDRFWTVYRVKGTHTEPLNFGVPGFELPGTGKRLISSPQAVSVKFNSENKIVHSTNGYVVDAWQQPEATDGKLGLAFGVLKAVGAPSVRPGGKMFNFVNWLGWFRKDFPKSKSHVDDLPEQYKARGRNQGLKASEAWIKNNVLK